MSTASQQMRFLQFMAWLVVAIMSINMVRVITQSGMHHGAGGDTFAAGFSDPWQTFINLDLVCGLLLAMTWVGYRERKSNRWGTAFWLWIIFYWGNIVLALYILRAISTSKGDWSLLAFGREEGSSPKALPVAIKALLYFSAAACTFYILWSLATIKPLTGVVWWGYLAGFAPLVPAAILVANRERLRGKRPSPLAL